MGKKARNRTAVTAQTFDAAPQYSISDPALAEFLGLAGVWGAEITEQQALSLTTVHRAQSLIAGTIAGLLLRAYEGIGSPWRWPRRRGARPARASAHS